MKRSIALFAAAMLIFSLTLLCGCKKDGQEIPPDTTAAEHREISLAEEWYIVRPKRSDSSLRDAAKGIQSALEKKTGKKPQLADDWLAPGTAAPEYEILIGNTDRPETAEALGALGSGEYTVRVIGKKIVAVGKNAELTLLAAGQLEKLVSSADPIYSDYMFVDSKQYEISSLTLNGTPIESFTVSVLKGADMSAVAGTLTAYISEHAGIDLATSSSQSGGHGIIIGNDSKCAYGDAKVYFKDGNLYLDCGSARAAAATVEYFIYKMIGGRTGDVALTVPDDGSTIWSLTMPERDVYIADPSRMPLLFENSWQPDPAMTDWNRKIDRLMCNDKKSIFTVAHRADFLRYPENSIEAIISTWAMGGDCVEIDVHFTKDGVPVIMHDASLKRTTNFALMAGKNGLPTSDKISDWTAEQLSKLCLREGSGGGDAALTPYRIPTLEEVLRVAKNRLFVICDKPDQWRYCDIPGIMSNSLPNYLLPTAEKAGNVTSLLISYGTIGTSSAETLSAVDALKIQQYIYEKTGEKTYFLLRGWTTRNTAAPYAGQLASKSLTNAAILVNGAFDMSASADIADLAARYPKSLLAGWTITDESDNEKTWGRMYNLGMRSIMTNDIMKLVRFAAEKAGN